MTNFDVILSRQSVAFDSVGIKHVFVIGMVLSKIFPEQNPTSIE